LLRRQVAKRELTKGIRELVAEARQKLGQGAGGDFSAWLDQAEQLAERIDPLATPNVGEMGPESG
jgi:hypothetical protein